MSHTTDVFAQQARFPKYEGTTARGIYDTVELVCTFHKILRKEQCVHFLDYSRLI